MATPTPGKHASSQAVATPPVSTPFSASNHPSHPAFSPHGPRSVVPSPQQLKKSPANSNTMFGYPGGAGGASGGGHSHPTNSSFGTGAGYDSPNAAMALGVVDSMGLEGMTPGGGLGALGGLGLGLGLGGGGLGVGGGGGRGEAEEGKRRRLEMVMEILKASKGRLSEAGIERLAKRVGMECLWEDNMGSGMRTLIIAGSALALDIDFANNVVKKVSLSFPESPEIVTRHTKEAGDILLRDLEFRAHESPLTKMLNRFAANLERLAALDKLSVIPGLNCHEAIAGIYESLERLHLWEVERLKESEEMNGKHREFVVKMAMCTRSGKPIMHTRDRLGMSLDYWQEKRRLPAAKKDEKTWALLIECAQSTGMVYAPLRVSEHWISTDIVKANPPAEDLFMVANSEPILDWLEPDNTLLPSTDPPKAGAMEGLEQVTGQKFPDVIFVAKFDPPLVVPQSIAQQVYTSNNVHIEPIYPATSFDTLLFPRTPDEQPDHEKRTFRREMTIPIFDKNGEKTTRLHQTTLFVEKMDYGRLMTEIPFSHPRQLVEMLPYLRQYAFLATVLNNSFGPHSKPFTPVREDKIECSRKSEFEAFMSLPLSSPGDKRLKVDVKVETQPVPRISVIFPFGRLATAHVVFEIRVNGGVDIVSQNLLPENRDADAMDEGTGRRLTVVDLARMLEVTEDLGIWVEFVKRRLG